MTNYRSCFPISIWYFEVTTNPNWALLVKFSYFLKQGFGGRLNVCIFVATNSGPYEFVFDNQ